MNLREVYCGNIINSHYKICGDGNETSCKVTTGIS
jgi:hypothetical protein